MSSLPSVTALSSRNVFLGCLFSNIQPVFFPSSEKTSVCMKLCLCVECCRNTDPNNRYAIWETPLNKRMRYDTDQVKLEFWHFTDYFCRISLHQRRCLLRCAAFSANTSPTFKVTDLQCTACVCMYGRVWWFRLSRMWSCISQLLPSHVTTQCPIPEEQCYWILESRMDGVRDPVNTPHGGLMV